MGKHWGFAIFYLTSAIQDAFFSILLEDAQHSNARTLNLER